MPSAGWWVAFGRVRVAFELEGSNEPTCLPLGQLLGLCLGTLGPGQAPLGGLELSRRGRRGLEHRDDLVRGKGSGLGVRG